VSVPTQVLEVTEVVTAETDPLQQWESASVEREQDSTATSTPPTRALLNDFDLASSAQHPQQRPQFGWLAPNQHTQGTCKAMRDAFDVLVAAKEFAFSQGSGKNGKLSVKDSLLAVSHKLMSLTWPTQNLIASVYPKPTV
jgi:hypothetical protein